MEHIKVFLSSTLEDLRNHRKAVKDALNRLDIVVVGMETFCAQPDTPAIVSLQEAERCDLFVGIYAYRYGSIPEGRAKSIIEMEFDFAVKKGIPTLAFLVDPHYDWPKEFVDNEPGLRKLNQLKKRIESKCVRELFTTPDDLATKVLASVVKYLKMHEKDSKELAKTCSDEREERGERQGTGLEPLTAPQATIEARQGTQPEQSVGQIQEVGYFLFDTKCLLDPSCRMPESLIELIGFKVALADRMIRLPNIGPISDRVDDLASIFVNWSPESLDDPSCGEFYGEFARLFDEFEKDYGALSGLIIQDAFAEWARNCLSVRKANPKRTIDRLAKAKWAPGEVLDSVNEDNLCNPMTILRAAQHIKHNKQTLALIAVIFDGQNIPEEDRQESLILALDLQRGDSHGILAFPIVRCLEHPKIAPELRTRALQQLADSASTGECFSAIGNEGMKSALALPDRYRMLVLGGALDSTDRSITCDAVRSLDLTDKRSQEFVAGRVMKWDPNTGEYAMIRLHDFRYEGLFGLLFEVARDHKEIALRKTAIRKLSEWGNQAVMAHLSKCANLEPNSELVNIMRSAIRLIQRRLGV